MTAYFVIYFRKDNILDKAKMKQQAKKWKEILCLLTDAVVICDGTGILFQNSAMEALFSPREIAGGNVLPAVLILLFKEISSTGS